MMYANGEQLVLQSETKTEIGQFNPLGQAYSMRIESKNNRYKKLKMLLVKVTYLFCSIHAFLNLVMELNEELFSFRNPMSPEFTITLNQIIDKSINLRIIFEHIDLALSLVLTLSISLLGSLNEIVSYGSAANKRYCHFRSGGSICCS